MWEYKQVSKMTSKVSTALAKFDNEKLTTTAPTILVNNNDEKRCTATNDENHCAK